jgi:hypothetical protein
MEPWSGRGSVRTLKTGSHASLEGESGVEVDAGVGETHRKRRLCASLRGSSKSPQSSQSRHEHGTRTAFLFSNQIGCDFQLVITLDRPEFSHFDDLQLNFPMTRAKDEYFGVWHPNSSIIGIIAAAVLGFIALSTSITSTPLPSMHSIALRFQPSQQLPTSTTLPSPVLQHRYLRELQPLLRFHLGSRCGCCDRPMRFHWDFQRYSLESP